MRFLQFFGLKFNPFRKEVPIEQLFASSSSVELRSRLKFLETTRGIGLVMGEPGSGKTTGLRAYLNQLNPASYHVCYFALSTLNVREFFNGLAIELGETPAFQRVKTLHLIQQAVQYGFIEKFIEELNERYNIREIAFDRWGAVQMVQNLEGMGFTVVPFGQGFKDMSPPTKELMKLTLEEKLAHGGHPVLRWMMDNIFIRTDPAGNIKPDKEKSTERIDGAVATIMALDRALRNEGQRASSVYDDRGLLVL